MFPTPVGMNRVIVICYIRRGRHVRVRSTHPQPTSCLDRLADSMPSKRRKLCEPKGSLLLYRRDTFYHTKGYPFDSQKICIYQRMYLSLFTKNNISLPGDHPCLLHTMSERTSLNRLIRMFPTPVGMNRYGNWWAYLRIRGEVIFCCAQR